MPAWTTPYIWDDAPFFIPETSEGLYNVLNNDKKERVVRISLEKQKIYLEDRTWYDIPV